MKHLTPDEVFQVVDGFVANGVKTRILAHLEVCGQCRSEVESTRKLERVARSTPLVSPSRDFAQRVMKRVVPQASKTLASRIIDNLGNILAMALVLSVVFIALTSQRPHQGSAGPSFVSKTLALYSEYYAKARDYVGKETSKRLTVPVKDRPSDINEIVMMTVVSIVILVGIDRFVSRRVARLRR